MSFETSDGNGRSRSIMTSVIASPLSKPPAPKLLGE
jgi:hypothetical protein